MSEVIFETVESLAGIEGLVHGFFSRHGGVSPPPYDSLNMAVATGDEAANVSANLKRVAAALGLSRLARVRQVHGVDVKVVLNPEDAPLAGSLSVLGEADILVTDRRDIGLVMTLADCQAVLAADPASGAIGAAHMGWRGLVNGGVIALIETMARIYGSDPAGFRAGLSPSLGPCCAEFINYRTEIPERFWAYRDERDHFDLPAIARDQLLELGLKPENIGQVDHCTRCRGGDYFSHRGQGPKTGRLGAVIGWRLEQGLE